MLRAIALAALALVPNGHAAPNALHLSGVCPSKAFELWAKLGH